MWKIKTIQDGPISASLKIPVYNGFISINVKFRSNYDFTAAIAQNFCHLTPIIQQSLHIWYPGIQILNKKIIYHLINHNSLHFTQELADVFTQINECQIPPYNSY